MSLSQAWYIKSPVDAPLAELLARQVEVPQVGVSETLDKILLNTSSCSDNHIHLTQRILIN